MQILSALFSAKIFLSLAGLLESAIVFTSLNAREGHSAIIWQRIGHLENDSPRPDHCQLAVLLVLLSFLAGVTLLHDFAWTVIKSNGKKRARLNAMRYVLHRLPYANKDVSAIGSLDSLLVGRANIVYERGENPGGVPVAQSLSKTKPR